MKICNNATEMCRISQQREMLRRHMELNNLTITNIAPYKNGWIKLTLSNDEIAVVQCDMDFDVSDSVTSEAFANVQNALHRQAKGG